MGHIICSVETGLNQSIVKLNLFHYFEKKKLGKVTLNKYKKAVEPNNEIILHFLLILVRIGIFSQINNNCGYVMDARVSHKPCPCPSFKILDTSGTDKLRPGRDWEILNCRLVTQHYKMQ
jgi:hypothetical protein